MTKIEVLSEFEENFLRPYLPPASSDAGYGEQHDERSASEEAKLSSGHHSPRPFVTLTYACSLDSMISLAPQVRTALSGSQTKSMTHYLRLHHDCILVGVGTAIADDPSLNCRYPGASLGMQPQPVVVDPGSRWDVTEARVTQLAYDGKGKLPWIIQTSGSTSLSPDLTFGYKRIFVEDGSIPSPSSSTEIKQSLSSRKINWDCILKALEQNGIKSVMIEGGATIINELLSRPDLVDTVIITIAPTWLGQGGTIVSPAPRKENGERINAANLTETIWQQFGRDVVLCGRLQR